jgi:hypothetical protein
MAKWITRPSTNDGATEATREVRMAHEAHEVKWITRPSTNDGATEAMREVRMIQRADELDEDVGRHEDRSRNGRVRMRLYNTETRRQSSVYSVQSKCS